MWEKRGSDALTKNNSFDIQRLLSSCRCVSEKHKRLEEKPKHKGRLRERHFFLGEGKIFRFSASAFLCSCVVAFCGVFLTIFSEPLHFLIFHFVISLPFCLLHPCPHNFRGYSTPSLEKRAKPLRLLKIACIDIVFAPLLLLYFLVSLQRI